MAHSRVGRVNRALSHYVCLYSLIFFDNLNIETLKIDPCRNKTHWVDCVSLSTRLSQKLKLKDLEVVGSESQVLWYLALSLQHESLVSWKLPAILQDRKIQPLTVSSKFQQQIMWLRHPKCMPRSSAGRPRIHNNRHYNTGIFPEGKQSPHSRPTQEGGWFTVESSSWAREWVHFFNSAGRNRPAEHELRCPVEFCPLFVSENHSHQSL